VSNFRVIVAGASAGGVEAYKTLVGGLPRDLNAALFLVLHIPSEFPSFLPEILTSKARLKVLPTEDGARVVPGEIRVAPPGYHTLIQSGHMRLVRGPRENRHRPAIDPLFRSAAAEYGPRAIGLILTGTLDDGTAGLFEIKREGGVTIVQDPSDADQASMPASALAAVEVDHCLPLSRIPLLLTKLAATPVSETRPGAPPPANQPAQAPDRMSIVEHEVAVAGGDPYAVLADDKQPGKPSVYSCPECEGVLWEVQDGELLRFRCRVGHAYSLESIGMGQAEALEAALWNAMKILEENVSICRRLVARARAQNLTFLVHQYESRIGKAEGQIKLLNNVLLQGPGAFSDYAGGNGTTGQAVQGAGE
jgi:two-component system chemotaxis response regulator CheB